MHWTHISLEFGETLGVMPFFGNAPLAADEGRRVRY